MRWRYGDTNPVVAAVDSATVIEMGDLLYQDTDEAKPASQLHPSEWEGGDRVTLQELFADNFLGVAMQRSRSGDTDPIRVAATGVFEFDCPRDTFELGDLVGPDVLTHPRACLADQQVGPVTAAKYAVARVAKRVATAADSVLVDIRSTVMTGGIM